MSDRNKHIQNCDFEHFFFSVNYWKLCVFSTQKTPYYCKPKTEENHFGLNTVNIALVEVA